MTGKISAPSRLSRRRFLGLVGLGAGALAAGGCGVLAGGRQEASSSASGVAEYELEAAPVSLRLGGRGISTWGYNGGLPGPEIRVKEGQTLRATVLNRLPEDTTIHWHGVPLPNEMDGVPDVTQPPIRAGENFTYEFVASDPGSYLYHSHVGLQLDRGLYGPLIIEPANETLSYDKEFVINLDDWLDAMPGTPEDTFEDLKSGGSAMSDMEGMSADMDMAGLGGDAAPPESSPDVLYPLYLLNGKPAEEPEEFGVRRGDRVRLRLINPSASTIKTWLLPLVALGAALLYRNRAYLQQGYANVRAFDLPTAGMYDALIASLLGGLYARVAGEAAETLPGGTVLEVSSGPGRLAVRLARVAPHIELTGVDLSPEMVEIAARRAVEAGLAGQVRFEVGDAGALPFPDEAFDGVVSTLSLHHWPDPARGLAEIHRVLKPGAEARIYDIAHWLWLPAHGGSRLHRLLAESPFDDGPVETVRWPGSLPAFVLLRLRRGETLR